MDILVTYDVNTTTKAGRRRLRQIAKVCEDFGQRVQYSVFECTLNAMQLDELQAKCKEIIRDELDSLRVYKLKGGRDGAAITIGRDSYIDFSGPLIF